MAKAVNDRFKTGRYYVNHTGKVRRFEGEYLHGVLGLRMRFTSYKDGKKGTRRTMQKVSWYNWLGKDWTCRKTLTAARKAAD